MAAQNGYRALFASAGTWTLLALAGCVSEFERDALAGRPCPCLSGWICDESAGAGGVCVSQSAAAGGSSNTGGSGGILADSGPGPGGQGGTDADAGVTLGDSGIVPPTGGTGGSSGNECGQAASPSATVCPPECDECVDGTCHIRCDEARNCSGTAQSPLSLYCPPGMHCKVSCSSQDNCTSTQLHCSGEYSCDVVCTGRLSCIDLSLGCADGPCSLLCGVEAQVCRDSIVLCGPDACQATCEGIVLPSIFGCENSCSPACGCGAS